MRMGKLLILVGVGAAVLSAVSFARLHAGLTKDEHVRYRKAGLAWLNLLAMGAFLLLLYAPRFELRLAAPILLLVYVVVGSRVHHRRLAESGFESAFLVRLRRTSMLGTLGLALLFLGWFLGAR